MSRGLGGIQRKILQELEEGRVSSTHEIAKLVWNREGHKPRNRWRRSKNPTDLPLHKEVNSTHRALCSLHKKGLIYKTERRAYGEVYWSDEIGILLYMLGLESDIPSSSKEILVINPHLKVESANPTIEDYQAKLDKLVEKRGE